MIYYNVGRMAGALYAQLLEEQNEQRVNPERNAEIDEVGFGLGTVRQRQLLRGKIVTSELRDGRFNSCTRHEGGTNVRRLQ